MTCISLWEIYNEGMQVEQARNRCLKIYKHYDVSLKMEGGNMKFLNLDMTIKFLFWCCIIFVAFWYA